MDRHGKAQEISFANGNTAQAIISSAEAEAQSIVQELHLPAPGVMFLICGGATAFDTCSTTILVERFAHEIASIAAQRNGIIVGGSIAKREVLQNVRQQRSIIILQGSGRLADELASYIGSPTLSFSIEDKEMAEILQHGRLHVFPLEASLEAFTTLLNSLLDTSTLH